MKTEGIKDMRKLLRKIKRLFFPTQDMVIGRFWKRRERILEGRGVHRLLRPLYLLKNSRVLEKYNAEIPAAPSISRFLAPHGFSGIYISYGAEIGPGCTLLQQVTVGSNTFRDSRRTGAPKVGSNVFIGAGAKIVGAVTVGDNARIGANCVVTTDVPANATVVMPAPRIIPHDTPRDNTYVTWDEYEAGRENGPAMI